MRNVIIVILFLLLLMKMLCSWCKDWYDERKYNNPHTAVDEKRLSEYDGVPFDKGEILSMSYSSDYCKKYSSLYSKEDEGRIFPTGVRSWCHYYYKGQMYLINADYDSFGFFQYANSRTLQGGSGFWYVVNYGAFRQVCQKIFEWDAIRKKNGKVSDEWRSVPVGCPYLKDYYNEKINDREYRTEELFVKYRIKDGKIDCSASFNFEDREKLEELISFMDDKKEIAAMIKYVKKTIDNKKAENKARQKVVDQFK